MTESAELALAGVRVVELAEDIAGPYAAKLLADLGAEVVKIEPPWVGDHARHCGPFPDHQPHPERSGLFLYLNTNKLGVTLNLDTTIGRDLFRNLIAQADVLIEDRALGWLTARGLGYETLCQQRPELVMTSITRFGQDGPQAHYNAYPLTTFHAGGEGYTLPGRLSLELFPGRAPVQAGGSLGEYDSGLCAAVATLGALLAGIGQHVDVSQQEALLNLNRPMLAYYLATGEVISRQRGYAFGGAVPCRDGYIMLRPIEDNHWRGLVRAMGRDELADDERFRTRQARTDNGALLNDLIVAWAMQHTKVALYERVAAEGCPVGYFATAEDVVQAPQLAAREFFVPSTHPEAGSVLLPSAPYRLSHTPWMLRRPAPLLGQHNQEVWCDRLGCDPAELPRLHAVGVM
jgi:crotonobetainyl-CoA:carnitine CoA-transferase CaiB-like acyl-CoA transferase